MKKQEFTTNTHCYVLVNECKSGVKTVNAYATMYEVCQRWQANRHKLIASTLYVVKEGIGKEISFLTKLYRRLIRNNAFTGFVVAWFKDGKFYDEMLTPNDRQELQYYLKLGDEVHQFPKEEQLKEKYFTVVKDGVTLTRKNNFQDCINFIRDDVEKNNATTFEYIVKMHHDIIEVVAVVNKNNINDAVNDSATDKAISVLC